MKAVLYRHTLPSSHLTLGVLTFDRPHRPIYTLELPWADNRHNASCIPCGEYEVVPHDTARFPDTWELLAVPDRSGILVHSGNTTADTQGCILPGLGQTPEGVYNSRDAMDLIKRLVGDSERWRIRIVDRDGISGGPNL